MDKHIIDKNREYWNGYADNWFGTTALPEYGVYCVTEDELHLFGDVSGKKLLEMCCGSGHSLKYHAGHGAGELWGVDLSEKQLENAERLLSGCSARLVCGAMEEDLGLPVGYFDIVYSIYGIGWTTDLEGTFRRIAAYLKPGGTFIFSWHHTLTHSVGWTPEKGHMWAGDKIPFTRSYFDEEPYVVPVDGSEVILRNRKISTYVNALAKAGFLIEQMVEQTDEKTLNREPEGYKMRKAQMMPFSVIFKARKLDI